MNFLNLMPGFVSSCNNLYNVLTGVAFVLTVTGLIILANQSFRERCVHSIKASLIRAIVVVVMLGTLINWTDGLSQVVVDLTKTVGLAPMGGGVLDAYLTAIKNKFGSNGLNLGAPPGPSTTTPAYSSAPISGLRLTHYGYQGDPNGDSNSLAGTGAFPFDTAPGSLVPLQSAALSPDVAQQFNVVPGQQFTVTTLNGDQMQLVYADKTADNLTGRIDVYDPQNVFASDGAPITTLQPGGMAAINQPRLGWIDAAKESLITAMLGPVVFLLSIIAAGVMWFMRGLQQIFYCIEVAISPLFIGMLMVPRLIGTATRFFLSLIAIILWPLGWAICDMATQAIVNLAVNPTNNRDLTAFNGSVGALAWWAVLAVWVVLSSFVAPLMISASLMGGSSGLTSVVGATLGATAAQASNTTVRVVGGSVAAAARNGIR